MTVKQIIPAPLRLQTRVLQRHWRDRRQGHWSRFSPPGRPSRSSSNPPGGSPPFSRQWEIVQPIPTTSHSHNKRRNLAQAITRLNNVIVQPKQILSFWHLVGAPTRRRGYQEGRAIVGDRLQSTVGGGLCQLSGMLYWLGLQAGVTVLERHPHSQDIYTDETRYAPLGSDATVVYGYKDLRLINSRNVPLSFRFQLEADAVRASLWAPRAVERWQVTFEQGFIPEDRSQNSADARGQTYAAGGVWIRTLRCPPQIAGSGRAVVQAPEIMGETFYRRSQQS